MRLFFVVSVLAFTAACTGASVTHVNAYTLEECAPTSSLMPKKQGAGPTNDKCQGTSNGDNCDDLSSGKVDCIGDGNSGQGDDKKHNCVFPQPGCDADGCCEEDVVDVPEEGDDGTTGGGDTGNPDDGSGPIT